VREGESVNSIAYETGFYWETLWNLAENNELKIVRKNPDTLLPGDLLTIPDLRLKCESGSTEKKHRFKRKGVPAKLLIRFLKEGEPRAGESYVLEVDGAKVAEGTLGSDGDFKHSIPPNAKVAVVRVGDAAKKTLYTFTIGTIAPVDCQLGICRRLRNLGYSLPDAAPDNVRAALQEFQRDHGIEVTGKADSATRDALLNAYGH